MLHTALPAAYVPPENLTQDCQCPECGFKTIVACGVLHLGHYKISGEVRAGLIWTCSDKCFLNWEHSTFMGQA